MAVATAQIIYHRFWYTSSMKQFSIGVSSLLSPHAPSQTPRQDVGMGALYLASKLEECPLRIRDLVNVYDLLAQRTAHTLAARQDPFAHAPMSYFGNTFYDLKDAVVVAEMHILKRLGFNVHVVLPYGTLINYLRVLGLMNKDASATAWGYLNDACVGFVGVVGPGLTRVDCKRRRLRCMGCPRSWVRRSCWPCASWVSRFRRRRPTVGGTCLTPPGMTCGACVD